MKYIFYSKFGDAYFLADIMANNGKDVVFFCKDKDGKNIGKNMKAKVANNIYKEINKADPKNTIIIFDMTGFGQESEFLQKKGYYTCGASVIADKLEEDRTFATKMLSQIVDIPPTRTFTDFNQAKLFVKSKPTETRFVFKPEGEDVPTSWTYVSKDVPDLLSRLEYYKSEWEHGPIKFELQDFIKGIECDFSGFMDKNYRWLKDGFELYFEDKKFMDGNLGPAVGCADAMQYFTNSEEPYFKNHLSELTSFLKENNFNGQIGINNIFSEQDHKPYALEITPRFGYDSFQNEVYILLEHHKDPALLLQSLAMGKPLPKDYFPQNFWGLDVRVSVPPYPSEKHGGDSKEHVVKFGDKLKEHLYFTDIMYNTETDNYECAGLYGSIGTVVACDKSISICIDKLYKEYMPDLNVADAQYRTDGGKRVEAEYKKLKEWRQIL